MVKRNNFVEIGRVVQLNYGPDSGKIAVVIDIVDQARALIDGPSTLTGVSRQMIPFRNLSLTNIKIDIPRCVRPSTLTLAANKAKVLEQWKASNWSKKLVRHETRQNLSDFDRFKVMVLRKKRSKIVSSEFSKLRKGAAGGASKAKAKPAKKA